MIITQSQAKALRRKKADLQLKNYELAFEIGVAPKTVPKILKGNYKAPKRIYASVMEWLAKDYQKGVRTYQIRYRNILLATYGSIKGLQGCIFSDFPY